ncbi:hypothetical protein [Bradyrhizobium sp. CCGUVB23]|nr:hypothetical protein [Bradyrhizobium sp. CCGUVB23]MCP3459670.1 hypothetical protein [Bradyrhizobium sp. CCGUVB23]
MGANFSRLICRELRGLGQPPRLFGAFRKDNENAALANFLKLLAER